MAAGVLCAAALVGCGNKFTGTTWKCSKLSMEGLSVEDEFQGKKVSDIMKIEFKDDGKVTLSTNFNSEESYDAEWEANGDEVTIKDKSGDEQKSVTAKLDGDKLVMDSVPGAEDMEMKVEFTKE